MALSKELFRLATYNSWPLQSMISPLALAKCGFSYKGRGDEVECFLCKTRISGWNEGDNPQQKHRQMAPNCQLLNGNCTDNLPMEFTLSVPNKTEPKAKSLTATDCASNQNDKHQPHGETSVLSSILDQARSRARKNGISLNSNGPGVDGSQPDFGMLQSEAERPNCRSSANEVDRSGQSVLIPERAAVDRAVPVHAHEQLTSSAGDPPKYPAFKEFSARVESFRKGIVGEGQTAEGLADAGWFHVGPNDKVRCFHCGGNLRDWEQGDDPWVEHKRWYDYCQYTKTHRPTPRPRAPEGPAILTIPSNIGSFRIEPREVKARMDTPTVRAILDMGYSRDKVKAVIEIRLSTTGDDFPNAESLLEALFLLEETATSTSAGATASSFASEDGNHSVYSNISTVASTASRSSGYSTASSSASAVLLQQDLTSLPPTNSPKDSAMSVQSKNSASKDKASSVSLKPESATVTTAPDATQSRTKAKKKKNKKKKTSSLAATSAANGDEDVATEETGEAQNDQEKMNVDEEEANIEGNFDDIPDEEASKWLEENRQLRDQRTCKVCMDAEVNTVFLPCGHLVCCATCSPHLRNCPICRTFIRGTVKTFLS